MVKVTTVKFSELGTNCWLPRRFIQGERCQRVFDCHYPEKRTCKAVDTELAYLKQQAVDTIQQIHAKMKQLGGI